MKVTLDQRGDGSVSGHDSYGAWHVDVSFSRTGVSGTFSGDTTSPSDNSPCTRTPVHFKAKLR